MIENLKTLESKYDICVLLLDFNQIPISRHPYPENPNE